jgi:hypothetical protein
VITSGVRTLRGDSATWVSQAPQHKRRMPEVSCFRSAAHGAPPFLTYPSEVAWLGGTVPSPSKRIQRL